MLCTEGTRREKQEAELTEDLEQGTLYSGASWKISRVFSSYAQAEETECSRNLLECEEKRRQNKSGAIV